MCKSAVARRGSMDKRIIYKPDERDYRAEILDIIRSDKKEDEINLLLQDYHDNDIASVLKDLTPEERERL